ncbi:hypothetical protein ACHQM5_014642 [Ranunculus cassubicifolius]
MPFPMKIQPIDFNSPDGSFLRSDPVKPVVKSRFKRLFERPFQSVLKSSSSSEKQPGAGVVVVVEQQLTKDVSNDFEPSSVCLAKMVQNFIEESNEKATKCGRNRCNCFHGNCNDNSDDELDFFGGFSDSIGTAPSGDACDILKSLVCCANISERSLLADTSKIVEMNKISKPRDDCRKVVTEGLIDLGYDASICKSKWEKSSSFPAGDYEYIDVIVEGDRLIIDIDFRSEFEIARPTKSYRTILQSLPVIFVGKSDRLQQILSIVSEGAKQSLKKKGMHFPPWRKAEYMKAKWFSPFTRTSSPPTPTPSIETPFTIHQTDSQLEGEPEPKTPKPLPIQKSSSSIKSLCCSITTPSIFSGEFELIFGETEKSSLNSPVGTVSGELVSSYSGEKEDKIRVAVSPWQPPAIKPKNLQRGGKIVTGLASILKEKP